MQGLRTYEHYVANLPRNSPLFVRRVSNTMHALLHDIQLDFIQMSALSSLCYVCVSGSRDHQTIDASPKYMVVEGTELRIKLAFPSQPLKLIAVLREPIARAYSMFDMAARGDFDRVSWYTCRSPRSHSMAAVDAACGG